MTDMADLKEVMGSIFRERRGQRGELIGLLQAVQAKLGYLPAEAMMAIVLADAMLEKGKR